MTPRSLFFAALAVVSVAVLPAGAALSVSSTGYTYSQDFDTLPTGTYTTGNAAAGAWLNDSTLAGWEIYKADLTATTVLQIGGGAGNTGGFYSIGSSQSADRALGGIGSNNVNAFGTVSGAGPVPGAPAGYIALGLNNTTGAALGSISVSFSGEQWRNGGNATAQTMVMEYGIGATFGAVSAWSSAGSAFDFTSPVVGATAAPVNGNVEGLVSGLGGTLNVSWAAGSTLWLRWIEVNDIGGDHGLAIDDFKVTGVSIIPEPSAAMVFGAFGLLGILRRRR